MDRIREGMATRNPQACPAIGADGIGNTVETNYSIDGALAVPPQFGLFRNGGEDRVCAQPGAG
jgi:hypothetical protein